MRKQLRILTLILALSGLATVASAQTGTQPPKGPDVAPGETSDRTPQKETKAPLSQKDAYKGETSDRTPQDGDSEGGVKPDHAGTPGEKK